MVVAAAATIIGWLLPAVLFMKARQSMAQSLDLSPHPAAVSPNARVGTPDTSSKAPHSSGVPATPRTPAGVRVAKHRKNLFGHEKPFDDEAAAAARRAAAALHQVASTKSPAISLARASKHAPGANSLLTASPTATVSAASSDDSRYSSDALSVPASSRPAPTAGLILPTSIATTAQQTRPPAVPFAAPCPRLLDSRTSASKAAAASALTAHSSAKPHGLARNAKPNRPTTALNEAACGDPPKRSSTAVTTTLAASTSVPSATVGGSEASSSRRRRSVTSRLPLGRPRCVRLPARSGPHGIEIGMRSVMGRVAIYPQREGVHAMP